MRVVRGKGGDLRCEYGGERLGIGGVLDLQNALDALDRGGLSRDVAGVGGEHRDIDFRALDACWRR